MLLHIANFADADRRTAVAGEVLALGVVTIASENVATGARKLMRVTAAAQMKVGVTGVALKVSADADAATASTVNTDTAANTGSRIVTIAAGDLIIECRRGSIMHFDVSLLDASLDPARAGVLPNPGEALGVHPTNGLFCSLGTAGAFLVPVFGVCHETFGTTKVRIELQDVS